MASTNLYNLKNEKIGQVELPDDVFNVEVRADLLHSVVRWQLASRRQGTHMTKTKGLVSGGGKKPFKQKGTGSARQGSTRSPLMPGGGTMFGPEPRDYSYQLPKKMRKLALQMALSHLTKNGKLMVVDSLSSASGKTAELNKNLKKLGFKKSVMMDATADLKFQRAAKNLPNFKYYSVAGLNVFDLLKYDQLIVTKDCIKAIATRCSLEAK
jgi:large subunit ribosomal protein L4